jgi:DNA repair protein RadA/Sms
VNLKEKTIYQCTNCGATFPGWSGRCSVCGEWNTISKVVVRSLPKTPQKEKRHLDVRSLNEVSISSNIRLPTNILEFDRVLGGGFVYGSVVLVAGEPGIGKSTLLMQVLNSLRIPCIYITGEESIEQLKLRATRLKINSDKLYILCETSIEEIIRFVENSDSNVIAIDSIQTLYSDEFPSPPGSLHQIRECTLKLSELAKKTNKIIILIGHINKEGNIAGPKVLEHIVDCVATLEGERSSNLRILRSLKNRFGTTLELGLFEMGETGLVELTDPEKILLSHGFSNSSGITFSAFIEGARCFVTEIQSLVSFSSYNIPQRNVNGYDFKRIQMILAVLDKKLNLNLRQNDIYVNITGGIFVNDTALDLAIAVSLFSSHKDIVVPDKIGIIGEIGLTGEVRNVHSIDKRIKEFEKLGFQNLILPSSSKTHSQKKSKAELIFVDKVADALNYIFNNL